MANSVTFEFVVFLHQSFKKHLYLIYSVQGECEVVGPGPVWIHTYEALSTVPDVVNIEEIVAVIDNDKMITC